MLHKIALFNDMVMVYDMVDMVIFEFFTVYTKLAEIALLASKDLTTVKKLPPLGLDLTDYYWFRSPMPN